MLVDFWTYTCINWLRTLGYVRAWADTYADQGLVVIGVHTPEFPFEGELDNVRWAAKEMRVDYPDRRRHGLRRSGTPSRNRYWPAIYLADAQGRIRYHHFGEGEYEESERAIQQLLREAGSGRRRRRPGAACPTRASKRRPTGRTWSRPRPISASSRAATSRRRAKPAFDRPHTYTAPGPLELNQWSLSGDWTIEGGASLVNSAGGVDPSSGSMRAT